MGADSKQIGKNEKHSTPIEKCRVCGNERIKKLFRFWRYAFS